jgi:hypothetical protein
MRRRRGGSAHRGPGADARARCSSATSSAAAALVVPPATSRAPAAAARVSSSAATFGACLGAVVLAAHRGALARDGCRTPAGGPGRLSPSGRRRRSSATSGTGALTGGQGSPRCSSSSRSTARHVVLGRASRRHLRSVARRRLRDRHRAARGSTSQMPGRDGASRSQFPPGRAVGAAAVHGHTLAAAPGGGVDDDLAADVDGFEAEVASAWTSRRRRCRPSSRARVPAWRPPRAHARDPRDSEIGSRASPAEPATASERTVRRRPLRSLAILDAAGWKVEAGISVGPTSLVGAVDETSGLRALQLPAGTSTSAPTGCSADELERDHLDRHGTFEAYAGANPRVHGGSRRRCRPGSLARFRRAAGRVRATTRSRPSRVRGPTIGQNAAGHGGRPRDLPRRGDRRAPPFPASSTGSRRSSIVAGVLYERLEDNERGGPAPAAPRPPHT